MWLLLWILRDAGDLKNYGLHKSEYGLRSNTAVPEWVWFAWPRLELYGVIGGSRRMQGLFKGIII